MATLSSTHKSQLVPTDIPTIGLLSPEDERVDTARNAKVVKLTDDVAALSATHKFQLSLHDNGVPDEYVFVFSMTAAHVHTLRSATGRESWHNDTILTAVSKLIARKCSLAMGKKVHAVFIFR